MGRLAVAGKRYRGGLLALAVVLVALSACSNPERIRQYDRLLAEQNKNAKTVRSPAAQATAPRLRRPLKAEGGVYVVQRGDTLYGISRGLNVPLRALIDSNNLRPPYGLQVGQALQAPTQRIHRIVADDTIYGVSRLYNVDRSELVRLNRLAAPYSVTVGQLLLLPESRPSLQAAAAQPVNPVQSPSAPAGLGAGSRPASASEPTPAPAQRVNLVGTAAKKPWTTGPLPQPPARAGKKFAWPVNGPILTPYGPQAGKLHNDGVNISAPKGTPILAAENGVVAYVGDGLRGFGNLLLLKHADGWVSAYAHADSLTVSRGQVVRRGQPIGRVGRSGSVSRPQLHFELRKGIRPLDPVALLEDVAS